MATADTRMDEQRMFVPRRPASAIAAEAARDLANSVQAIERWRVKVAPGSRPMLALEILYHAAATGRIAPHQRGDNRGLRALQLALDIKDIAATLPSGTRRGFQERPDGLYRWVARRDAGGPEPATVSESAYSARCTSAGGR